MTATKMTPQERTELLISLGGKLHRSSYHFASGFEISGIGILELSHERFAEKIEELRKSLSKM